MKKVNEKFYFRYNFSKKYQDKCFDILLKVSKI